MKASFITDEAAAPDFPEEVRFFNVDIETGNPECFKKTVAGFPFVP